jgi:beta-N-acetylhexosaminidase
MRIVSLFLILFTSKLLGSWVESTLVNMTTEERVAQLFIIPTSSHFGTEHQKGVIELIARGVGGTISKSTSAEEHVAWLQVYQEEATIPLLVTVDAENGLGMRMKDVEPLPKNLTQGALKCPSILYDLGGIMGTQCRHIGAHMSLGPVVDVITNPKNPIIHTRSFGSFPKRVAECAKQQIEGFHSVNCLVCIKHFPGHGSAAMDSHLGLPVLGESLDDMAKVHLLPFKKNLMHADAVMTAHLAVPSLDSSKTPATLSKRITHDLLRKNMGFNGLIITDALNMGALHGATAEETAKAALEAGADILLYGDHISSGVGSIISSDVPRAIDAIVQAVEEGTIPMSRINQSVRRILKAKQKLNLHTECKFIVDFELSSKLNTPVAQDVTREIYENSVTLVDENKLVKRLQTQRVHKIGYIAYGTTFGVVDPIYQKLRRDPRCSEYDASKNYDIIIATWWNVNENPRDAFGFTESFLSILHRLPVNHTIHCIPGPALARFHFPKGAALLIGNENHPDAIEAMIETLQGRFNPIGKLHV